MFEDMLQQTHLLIGGTTGSGKSTLIKSLVITLLHQNNSNIILIDPKKIDLFEFRGYKNVVSYSTEIKNIISELKTYVKIMDSTYNMMKFFNFEPYPHYIIIDEFADLMTLAKKEVTPLIMRLAQLGRGANFHQIIATQRPTRDIITGKIKTNLTATVALHTSSPQESRNLIGISDAFNLPIYGQAIYQTPAEFGLIDIPLTTINNKENLLKDCKTNSLYKLWRSFR